MDFIHQSHTKLAVKQASKHWVQEIHRYGPRHTLGYNIFYFQIQTVQGAAEMVKSRCKNLLQENSLITKNKNKKLKKVSLTF